MSQKAPTLGDVVTIKGEKELAARIVGILSREDGAQYEIAWFFNGARQTAWVYPSEIEPGEAAPGLLGFKPREGAGS